MEPAALWSSFPLEFSEQAFLIGRCLSFAPATTGFSGFYATLVGSAGGGLFAVANVLRVLPRLRPPVSRSLFV